MRRTFFPVFLSSLIAAIVLAACGGGGTKTVTRTATPPAAKQHATTSSTTSTPSQSTSTTTSTSTGDKYGTPTTKHGVQGCQTPYGFSPHVCGFGAPPPSPPKAIRPQATAGLHTMVDSISLSALKPFSNPFALAGYTSGWWPTYLPFVHAYPNAHVKSIAVNASHHAQCLDVEPGDAVASQAGPWVKAVLHDPGMHLTSNTVNLPCIYASLSNMGAVKANLAANGLVHGRDFWLWDANWTFSPHIDLGFDATQYADHGPGGENVDMSMVTNGFLGIDVNQPNKPAEPTWWSPNLSKLDPHRHKLHGRDIDERDTVRVWVKDHCLNPVRRPACRRMRTEMGLEKARVSFLAHHGPGPHYRKLAKPDWGKGKPGSYGTRNKIMQQGRTLTRKDVG